MKPQLFCKLFFSKQNYSIRCASKCTKFMLISSEDCSLCHNFKTQLDTWNIKNGKIIDYKIVPLKSTKEIFDVSCNFHLINIFYSEIQIRSTCTVT